MGKIPSVEEIKNYLEAFENASRENHVIRGSSIEEIAMKRKLTLPLMSACEQTNADPEKIWKLCKKFAQFSHAPIKLNEYERMTSFAQEECIVDTVLKTLETYHPSEQHTSADFGFDTIGYYYCIALISQSDYRIEDCKNRIHEICRFYIQNPSNSIDVLKRNMSVLKNKRPYLREYEEYLELENSSEEDRSVYD